MNLEQKYKNKKIILIAHGDALQILQSGFQKICSSKHRSLEHLETAEIRELTLN
jgi:probable phosphoglycerate mutase